MHAEMQRRIAWAATKDRVREVLARHIEPAIFELIEVGDIFLEELIHAARKDILV